MDYRDIPVPEGKYNKITCLEMAEHVGVRKFGSFCQQVNDMLEDDGIFFLQIAGLRKPWQYEDFTWGLFMNKYVFPGADASTPLGFFVDKLEGAGFEIKQIDTIGVHYSATLWKWYRNWMGNQDKVVAKYGKRWFRVGFSLFHWDTWQLLKLKTRSGNISLLSPPSHPAKVPRLATRSPSSRTSTPPTVSRASNPNTLSLVHWLQLRASRLSCCKRRRIQPGPRGYGLKKLLFRHLFRSFSDFRL